jgi:pimeloyl-ACP methyl ester carboxylesterase
MLEASRLARNWADLEDNLMSETKPVVIALPCSGSSGSQWRSLEVALNGHCTVFAPDLMTHAVAVAAAGKRNFTLIDEAAPFLRAIDGVAYPIHLVGHSYGGAVALRAALERPQQISSITLFEPTSFHLLDQACPQDRAALVEIQEVSRAVSRAIASGRPEEAARTFVDYWSGGSVWTKLRSESKDAIIRYIPKATLEFSALLNEAMLLQDYAKLDIPLFIMEGEFGPAPSRRIARRLAGTLPRAFHVVIPRVGHMAPVTNAELIATEIAKNILQTSDCEAGNASSSRVAA